MAEIKAYTTEEGHVRVEVDTFMVGAATPDGADAAVSMLVDKLLSKAFQLTRHDLVLAFAREGMKRHG